MNKKQIIGLVVAGLVFSFVCAASVISSSISKSVQSKSLLQEAMASQGSSFSLPVTSFICTINVQGTIMEGGGTSFGIDTYNHEGILSLIDACIKSKSNKGLLLKIDSPGGSVYASDELYKKLMKYKEETKRPIWTYMEGMACSGGYYVAMPSDVIYANRNTTTGSIGVIMQYSNMKGLFEKIGIENVAITSAGNKDIGSPYKDMTPEQSRILQSIVDEAFDQFLGVILDNRDISETKLRKLADGRIYTAKQALESELIDEIADYEDVVEHLEKEYKAKLYAPKLPNFRFSSFFNSLGNIIPTLPKSDADLMSEIINDRRNGVLMYYVQPGY